MNNDPDIRIFISRDTSRDLSEGQYFAEVCPVDANGVEIEDAEPIVITGFEATACAARLAAIGVWLDHERAK